MIGVWPTLRDGFHRYELRLWLLELSSRVGTSTGEEVEFLDECDAQTFLSELLTDEANLDVVREFLARDFARLAFFDLRNASDQRITEVLAWAITRKDLRVLRVHAPLREVLLAEEPEALPPRAAMPVSSWIEVKAIWDETGEAIAGLPLVLEAPGGRTEMRTTDHDGRVRLDPVDPGACEARCSFATLSWADCAVFVGMGEGDAERQKRSAAGGKKLESQPKAIIQFLARKVRTGETPESIAREAGLKWQDIAFFNWGTKVPEEIDRHLADDVGCTKRAADGQSYVFDDGDSPGVILVPRQWKRPGLATRRQHIVRVRPLALLSLVLENDEGLRLPEVEYRVVFGEGTGPVLAGNLGLNGTTLLPIPAEGDFEVAYPDEDDVLAKSLAASVRKAFDDGDTGPLFRLFAQDRVVVKAAAKAYDAYFNTYTGGGISEDIRQILTDPEALSSCERLLALHGMG